MTSQSDPGVTKFLARFTAFCSILSASFGILVLTGWALHIHSLKTILPGQIAVRANVAACFVLIGIALWLMRKDAQHRPWSRALTVQVIVFFISFVGLLSFLEYWYGWDLGIDQLLFAATAEDVLVRIRPGMMSPIASLSLLLLGPALSLLDSKTRLGRGLSQIMALSAAIVCLFGILHFVLDFTTGHTYIAAPAALMFFLFAVGLLCARTDSGLSRLIASSTLGGTLSRRLLPTAIIVPIVIAWLRSRGQEAGLYSNWTGITIMTVSCSVLLAGITAWTALVIDRTDAERQSAADTVRRLASVVTSSNDAIFGKTLEGIVTSWNPGAEEIYGYSAQEMIGRSISVTIPPDLLDDFQTTMQQVTRGEQVRQHETLRIRKDGKPLHVSLSVSPIRDETGKIVGASTTARDIGDRIQAEEKLREASRYSRSLLEASLDPLVTISREGKITDANEAAEKATGVPRAQLIGSDFSNYFSEPEKARHGYLQVFAEGFVRDYPLGIRHTCGRITDVLYNATVFKDQRGEIAGVFAAARDITERKRAEQALRIERQRFRDVLDKLPVYVVLLTPDYHVALDNSVFRQRFGESGGRRCYEFLFGRNAPCEICETYKVLQTNSAHQWKWTGPDSRHYDIFDFPFSDTDGSPLILEMGMDITERERAEEEVRRLNVELEQRVSQRTAQLEAANKELEAFTYSVSHDLRAPLRHISGFAKILMEEFATSLPADAQHHLQRIDEGTRRMGVLVDDLLNLARVGRRDLSLNVTGLASVVNEVIAELKTEAQGREIEWKIGALPYVECDPGLMKQVFQNLLSNALKFTRPRPRAVIEVGQQEKDGTAVVYVRDNGVGFSMKYADKLFGVFQRLHRAEDFEGTGVGLATVQRIIQKHGGRIWAEAELDKGATFYFTLGNSEKNEPKAKAAVVGDKHA
jgi:PAS domain S-box-containing protein